MIYRITWLLLQGVFRLVIPRRVRGVEHVPESGPVILAANHVSNLDPPAVGTGFWRPGTYMAKQELFKHPLFSWYIRHLNAFPVERGAADRGALKQAMELLEQGRMLVMFPEGTRSETGELKEPELGVAMIAFRTGAPVVPAYISGTDRVMPKGGGLKPGPISVTYGPPLRFSLPDGQKPRRADYERAAHEIMAAIARLRDETPP